ncbi:MAG: hypothetical protein WA294_17305, partial [Acidobacteriaceae bacterium]
MPHPDFPRAWQAEILLQRPLILPPRHFTFPREAEEVERGALEVMIRPESHPPFLATFALGFADPAAPSGIWTCPSPCDLCAVAGGYAYIIDTRDPLRCTHLPLRPVLEIRPVREQKLLLFAASCTLLAWGTHGLAWQTVRLSSEGLRIVAIGDRELHGIGWDHITDREIPFVIDLRTGEKLNA